MKPKAWADARTRTFILIAAAAVAVLTISAVLLIPLTGSGTSSALGPSTRPTSPAASISAPPSVTPSPSPSPATPSTPTPAPSDVAQPLAPAEPPVAEPAPEPPPVAEPAPAPPPAPMAPPRIIAFDWVVDDYVRCPDLTSNKVVLKDFSWTAEDASTVDIYVARMDHDAQATTGYALVASGLNPSGVASVPISCGSTGFTTYFTVRLVATNASGSVAAHWWGAAGY